jgi:hypothetical protein
MTSERDIERLLDRWLADHPTQVADRVLDGVADRIARQSQHQAWRVLGRDHTVNAYLKPLLAVAAVVVIAVAGIGLLGRPANSPGGAGSPAPTPSPTASAAPSAAASAAPSSGIQLPSWYPTGDANGAGILAAGSHATRAFSPGFSFSVPEGWVNTYDEAGYFTLFPDTPANQAEFERAEGLAHSIYMGPHESPYFVCQSFENNRGATAAEMVTALVANEAVATTGLVDVAIGGLTGKQFDVRLDPDWTEPCPGDPPDLDLTDYRVRGLLLDVPGRGVIVIFVDSLHSAEYEAFLAEAMPIIESFQFDLSN